MRKVSVLNRILERWPVKVICIALAIVLYILFRVNTITEREITVPLEVVTSEGFVVSSEYPDSINVTLRGEEDEIKGILPDDVQAFADLTPFPEEGEYQIQVELRKKGTALQPDALEFRPRPRDLLLSQEPRTVRSIAVQPELSGFPALGYELTQYFISPSSVTVIGPESQMAGLKELKTEIIDLSARRDDFTVTTRIIPPSSQIEIPGGQIVEFRGVIEEAVITRNILDREIVVIDLAERLRIDGDLPRVSLTVQGSQLIIESAGPQGMTFYIDCSGVNRPGSYVLPLKMDIPQGLAILELQPREVSVRVVPADGESQ